MRSPRLRLALVYGGRLAIVAAIAGLIYIKVSHAPAPTEELTETPAPGVTHRPKAEPEAKNEAALTKEEESAEAETEADAAEPTSPVSERSNAALTEYALLKLQVLPTEETQKQKEQILRDEEMLLGLRESFKALPDPAAYPGSTLEAQHSSTIDLWLEARATTHSDAAKQAMLDVIDDNRIEDAKIDIRARKIMAGLKAEIMYRWSAQEAEMAGEIAGRATGPVSQRLWANVNTAQRQNLAESRARRPASGF